MFTTVDRVYPGALRLENERWLKHVNIIVGIGVFACLVITITDVETKAQNTLEEFWISDSSFNLDPQLSNRLRTGCWYSASITMGDYSVGLNITELNRNVIFAHGAGLIRRGVLVSCGAVFVTALNKIFFNYNWHRLRYNSLIVPKSYLLLLEVCGIVWSIIALAHPRHVADYLTDYIKHCGGDDVSHLFKAPPFIPMYVAHGVNLLTYGINLILLINNSTRAPPPDIREEWEQIVYILSRCDKGSDVPYIVEETLRESLEGRESNVRGIRYLLAEEHRIIGSGKNYEPSAPPAYPNPLGDVVRQEEAEVQR